MKHYYSIKIFISIKVQIIKEQIDNINYIKKIFSKSFLYFLLNNGKKLYMNYVYILVNAKILEILKWSTFVKNIKKTSLTDCKIDIISIHWNKLSFINDLICHTKIKCSIKWNNHHHRIVDWFLVHDLSST